MEKRTIRIKTPYPLIGGKKNSNKSSLKHFKRENSGSSKLGKRSRSPQPPRRIPSDFEEDEKKVKQETERIPASVPAKRKRFVTFSLMNQPLDAGSKFKPLPDDGAANGESREMNQILELPKNFEEIPNSECLGSANQF